MPVDPSALPEAQDEGSEVRPEGRAQHPHTGETIEVLAACRAGEQPGRTCGQGSVTARRVGGAASRARPPSSRRSEPPGHVNAELMAGIGLRHWAHPVRDRVADERRDAGRPPQRLIRSDAAGCTHELLDWITAQRLSYLVGFTPARHHPTSLRRSRSGTGSWPTTPTAHPARAPGCSHAETRCMCPRWPETAERDGGNSRDGGEPLPVKVSEMIRRVEADGWVIKRTRGEPSAV